MKKRFLGLALAVVLAGSAFAQSSDPNEALTKINEIRKTRPTTQEEATKQQTEVRAIAEAALKGVDFANAEASKSIIYVRLLMTVGNYDPIVGLVEKFLTTNPAAAEKNQALNLGIMGAAYTDSYEKGMAFAEALPSTTEAEKMAKASMIFNWLGDGIAKVKGNEGGIRFVKEIIASLPATVADEKMAPQLFSVMAGGYEALADMQNESGDKKAAVASLEEGIGKITDARFKRGLQSKQTQLKAVGETAPEVVVNKMIGDFKGMAAYKGKVVVLDFFAHWCGPCKASFGDLRKLYADLKEKGVEIVHATKFYKSFEGEQGLTEDQEFDKMKGFAKKHELVWPIIFVDDKTMQNFGVSGIPHIVLIDADGKVNRFKIGYSEASFAEFRKKIEEMVAAKGK